MRAAIVIRAGRLVRPEGISDEDWGLALMRRRRSRRWARAHKLADEVYNLMNEMLKDVDNINDDQVLAVRQVAQAALDAAIASTRADDPRIVEPVMRLRRRLSQYST